MSAAYVDGMEHRKLMTFRHMIVLATLAISAMPAMAHPKLLSASPAANTAAAKTGTVRLVFNQRLAPATSTATLVMTGMPGMANHPDMKMPVSTAIAADGKTIVMTSAKPLPTGTYRVDWTVVGADSHRIAGKHAFSIR
ncbi:copper resistance protein CopC [Sphingomonas floccifaciens]|uniref:Copper resistance protein CopC n=1 Tax=Sphingomonas floccifaciens TaxID=1844115 RepID=A0ABW4NFM7_9SPHN